MFSKISTVTAAVAVAVVAFVQVTACSDCQKVCYPMYAGQNYYSGEFCVQVDNGNIITTYNTTGTQWVLTNVHIELTTSLPTDFVPGQFSYTAGNYCPSINDNNNKFYTCVIQSQSDVCPSYVQAHASVVDPITQDSQTAWFGNVCNLFTQGGKWECYGTFTCVKSTQFPTKLPSLRPSQSPTKMPTSQSPSQSPTKIPTSQSPSQSPTKMPTSQSPSQSPTKIPTSQSPSQSPTKMPTSQSPSQSPTKMPTSQSPSQSPTKMPTSQSPSQSPTKKPTSQSPSQSPTKMPTSQSPSQSPTKKPTNFPTPSPTQCSTGYVVNLSYPIAVTSTEVSSICAMYDPSVSVSKWGWTNGVFSSGKKMYGNMYVGAAKCDKSRGIKAADVTVEQVGTQVSIKINYYKGFSQNIAHIYVGKTKYPSSGFNSPGLYPFPTKETDVVINGFDYNYVIIHAEVCY